jgi:hypothetical protein
MQREKWQNNGYKPDDRTALIVTLKSSGIFLLASETQHVLFRYLMLNISITKNAIARET